MVDRVRRTTLPFPAAAPYRVRHSLRRIPLIMVLCLAIGLPAWAELTTTIELELMNALLHTPSTGTAADADLSGFSVPAGALPLSYLLQGTGQVEFKAVGNRNVKAELSLRTIVGPSLNFEMPRGFVKVRFPHFRMTVGKARVSWGDGVMFNAGDLIFGSTDLQVDLTADELRDDGKLLTEVYIPIRTFSFIEALVTAPEFDPAALAADPSAGLPDIRDTSAGARIQFKPLGLKVEAGYWYAGADRLHRAYTGFQGAFGDVDWHLSAATALPDSYPEWRDLYDSLTISAGISSILKLSREDSLTMRLEALSYPAGLWSEADGGLGVAEADRPERYGLYLYPELTISLGQSVTLMWRNIVSPIDQSLSMIVGGSWNIYQGLYLFVNGMMQAGDDDDVFGWPRDGDAALMAGMRFVY